MMEQGTKIRTTASTNMNASSSRSHMGYHHSVQADSDLTKHSSINLVDLAGSERQKSSGSEGDRLKEGSRVNALADAAMGKRVLHVPYRDSVLTKLLQPALGGNSRMTLIAAISPADICYEETLSTLRYAERAKKIQNKAVVNTSTLMRESKAENNKVLLTRGNSRMAGKLSLESSSQPTRWQNQGPGPQTGQPTWVHQLEQAREEWHQQYLAITQEQQMTETFPHLLNVNKDPQLTGVLKYFIQAGLCDAGRAASNAILLQGLGISDKHASFTNLDGKVTVMPHSKCKVVVNGVPIVTKTKLQHLDRIILGSNSSYLYIGFPSERGNEDLNRFDYDFFQLERAAAEGVSVDKLGAAGHGEGNADPSVLAVFQDYVKLMPLVAEANQMREELEKGLRMELKVKNLASSDSRGYDLQKEVMVKVTHQRTHETPTLGVNLDFCEAFGAESSIACGEEDVVFDPSELLGKGMDF
ncbi:hypothetical protein GH733_010927 [Mirounga leonina]|nr:hypothetical protein GH733_010927 [Mirounga leonina]